MTDLSATLDQILQKHNSRIQQHRRSIEDLTDEFLKQAYRIRSNITELHKYLLSIRAPYLSTTQPPRTKRPPTHSPLSPLSPAPPYFTNTQRDSIDSASKATLRDLHQRLAELSATEEQRKTIRAAIARKKAEKRAGGRLGAALGRWAAGDEAPRTVLTPEEEEREAGERTTDEWREGVLWFLRNRLGAVVDCQRDMMERRVMREVERSKSVLYNTKARQGKVGGSDAGGLSGGEKSPVDLTASQNSLAMEDSQISSASGDAGFTPAQLQEFAQENDAMLKHYENSLEEVRAAERSMMEISELQTTLISNLEIQSERIDQLGEDSRETGDYVSGGNKQLKRAAVRWRPAKWFFYVSCGLSGFLVVWDLVF